MDLLIAAAAGAIGTIGMIGLIYWLPVAAGGQPLSIPHFVGGVLTSHRGLAGLLGTGMLLFNGSVIACLGRLILPFGTGAQAFLTGLGYGAVLGTVSIGVMLVLLAVHPAAADMKSVPKVPVAISLWLGHLVYGGCIGAAFAAA